MSELYPEVSSKIIKQNIVNQIDQPMLNLDMNVYCKVYVIPDECIKIKFYIRRLKNDYDLSYIVFVGNSAQQISKLIGIHLFLHQNLSTSHAMYIGIELTKAEIALITNQHYSQN
uniref:DUF4346 domain-containing protein n=1 Tax=Helminthocladia australis TaxID=260093 RepID=A0A1G4NTG4_9FLOR|nr:Hypothetical protein ORF_1 [Helminthocladia australis]SCW21927.1 Hypothetical protein ORF_1 [Helminthocladia australis]